MLARYGLVEKGQRFSLNDVACNGDELSLLDCPHTQRWSSLFLAWHHPSILKYYTSHHPEIAKPNLNTFNLLQHHSNTFIHRSFILCERQNCFKGKTVSKTKLFQRQNCFTTVSSLFQNWFKGKTFSKLFQKQNFFKTLSKAKLLKNVSKLFQRQNC